MGPLGQWRLQDSSGLWTKVALGRVTQQCGDVLSISFSFMGTWEGCVPEPPSLLIQGHVSELSPVECG